jgi:hypothetical protein
MSIKMKEVRSYGHEETKYYPGNNFVEVSLRRMVLGDLVGRIT